MDSLDEIYEKYYPSLTIQAYNIVNDEQAAQDIASNTILKLLDKSMSFESQGHMEGFLRLVTRNSAIDHLRSLKLNRKLGMEFTKLYLDEYDIMNIELDNALLGRLSRSVDELPEKSQQVIRYLYVQRLSYQNIADLMDTTIKNVENIRTYALKKLKISLQSYEH